MKVFFAVLVATLFGAILAFSCGVDYCGGMQQYLTCPDPVIRAMAQEILATGNQDTCRLYVNAWMYTYQPVCVAYGRDAGTDGSTDTGPSDTGTPDADVPDSGTPDSTVSDTGLTDSGDFDAGISDSGQSDAESVDAVTD